MQKAQQAFMSQHLGIARSYSQTEDQGSISMTVPQGVQRDDGWLEGFLAHGQMTDTAQRMSSHWQRGRIFS